MAHSDRLRQEAGTLGTISDDCRVIQRALESASLPSDAFGGTRHGPLVSRLCATFATTVAARMASAARYLDRQSAGVRQAAVQYLHGDERTAEAYRGITLALAGR